MNKPSRIIEQFISWLELNRLINILLIAFYFVFIYYMHDVMVHVSVWVMNGLSLAVYNKVVIAVFTLFLILFSVFLYMQLKDNTENLKLKIFYLVSIVSLIVVHFKIMFEMNIEIIHMYEFPVLAILIFPLTRSFGSTILLTLPFMLIDEWHQYIVLYPSYVDYFEFNDVVLDINGCALAMVSLMICGVRGRISNTPLWKKREFIALCFIILLIIASVKTCFIALYEEDQCSNTWLVLNRIHEARNFWRQYPGRDVVYHVMQPLESLIIIPSLILFYFGMDAFRKKDF